MYIKSIPKDYLVLILVLVCILYLLINVLLSVFCVCGFGKCGYKPVIVMHGILDVPGWDDPLMHMIETAHPGTNVTSINAFSSFISSFDPLWEQTHTIQKTVTQVMKEHPEGVHLLCFSQGGLICRALLQILPNHNVHNFIALSNPLAGQYGDTSYLKYFFPGILKQELYRIFYTEFFQKEFSVANYWNDPYEQEYYKEYSIFLAVLNNQTHNPLSHEYKKNFLRVKNVVAIGGPDDGVITPWQSSHFSFYNVTSENVISYKQHEWYTKDSFGLRTLEERGGYHTYTVPGVKHTHWHRNKTVFDNYIVKWLT